METETRSATPSRAPAPYLKVSSPNLTTDWDELADTYWESWKNPRTAWSEISCPFIGSNTAEEAHARAEFKKRGLVQIHNDPSTHMLKCTDTRSGRIIGGGMWRVHRTNPYRAPLHEEQAVAFPEGSEMRELAESAWSELSKWRQRLMQDAHISGEEFWALPEYRSQGAGNLLLDEFLRIIDDHQLEAFGEVTHLSRHHLEKRGFVAIAYADVKCPRANPSENLKRLVRNMQQHPLCIIWRPAGGGYVEGKTILPWEGQPRRARL
ncbi:hypothetical protein P168DRAFT_279103 [Aspergillus campestris IBT 28561]|uniref:N-acetyltransferase domain-containing protein n=1 Tax=Aspergillus campestris (strain IBT 28561) TaxID=1392248 RepID=A0A2I1DB47_ASPC2|nr:uncharacterized protein P168DRAFT_279103 [Aspergillus campestris IBT 28561]PKY07099.1 hypothetical protein P168DRAFT_279103 [Aspergillus campestris IBT 28561]